MSASRLGVILDSRQINFACEVLAHQVESAQSLFKDQMHQGQKCSKL